MIKKKNKNERSSNALQVLSECNDTIYLKIKKILKS